MLDQDTAGAFCEHGRESRRIAAGGPLADLTFAVKDLFDVEGLPTGAGNPDWLRTHPVPTTSASAVERLLAAGACFVGKTKTDELAWSLSGQNAHYGTPANTAAPGRVPGGSSSGSASAVAAGLADAALGSDTGGSVRLPASFCGLYGLRPTHGRIPIDGAVPLAPSFDTVGWFARDPEVFARVGRVLLPNVRDLRRPARLMLAEDLFGFAGAAARGALAGGVAAVESLIGKAEPVDLAMGELQTWRETFRIVQSAEAWAAQGAWISRVRPALGPGVRDRFAAASELDPASVDAAVVRRASIRAQIDAMLRPGSVLLLPTAREIAPRLDASDEQMDRFRAGALALLCPAGLAGLPQLTVPVGELDGCPIGLSLIGARGEDEALLDLACALGRWTRGGPTG